LRVPRNKGEDKSGLCVTKKGQKFEKQNGPDAVVEWQSKPNRYGQVHGLPPGKKNISQGQGELKARQL